MSKKLNFEFNLDEILEGVKQGVIRELAEANFEEAKDIAINKIKREVKEKIGLTYKDESELKNEVKNEIKEKVFESLIKEVDDKYLNQFNDYLESQLTKNPDRLNILTEEIKNNLVEDLYNDLFSSIKKEVVGKVSESTNKLCNLIGGNSVRIADCDKVISKEEYEELLDRDKILSALEAGGVDNWEWYGESIEQYYDDKN